MNLKEADAIITKYMSQEKITHCCTCGGRWFAHNNEDEGHSYSGSYSSSLDALAPVWRKLVGCPEFEVRLRGKEKEIVYSCKVLIPYRETFLTGSFGTIQAAACIATAKAIAELLSRENSI